MALPLYLELEYLVTDRSFFSQVVDHSRAIERSCIMSYRGSDKRIYHWYSVIGIPSKREDLSGRSASLVTYQFYIGSS